MCVSETQEGSACNAGFSYCNFQLLCNVLQVMLSFYDLFTVFSGGTPFVSLVSDTGSSRMPCRCFLYVVLLLLLLLF